MRAPEADFRLRIVPRSGPEESPLEAPAEASDRTALRAFSRARQAEPGDPDYEFILGLGLLRASRPADAVARFRDAIRLGALDPEYHFALGRALWQLGRAEEAEAAFRECARLRPDASTLNAHGAALARVGRTSEAVEALECALRADPLLASAHGNLGVALWQLDRRPEALRHLRRAVRLGRRDADALHNLAQALLASGHAADALKPLRALVACDPGCAEAHLELGVALFHAGRHDEAGREIAQAAALDPAAIAGRPEAAEVRDALTLARIRSEAGAGRPRERSFADLASVALALPEVLHAVRPRHAGNLVLLALTAALLLAGGRLASAYVRHYLVRDEIRAAARAPVRQDDLVRDRVAHAVRKHGLEEVLDAGRCEIATSGQWRRIRCQYAVALQLLPGWRGTLPLRLRIEVEEPFLVEPDPIHF